MSRDDAVRTTANFRLKPPEIEASSEIKCSLCVALISGESRVMERVVRMGEVTTIVTTTAAMAALVVRRRGKRIVGLSWLMLSRPEKASHAAENPTRTSLSVISLPGERVSRAVHH